MKNALFLLLFAVSAQAQKPFEKEIESLLEASKTAVANGQFDEALQSAQSAETLAADKTGRESAIYAKCCTRLGKVFEKKEALADAQKWYSAALAIHEKLGGKAGAGYAVALGDLGYLFYLDNDFEEAEPLFLEAFAVIEKSGGGGASPDFSQIISDFGKLYYFNSQFGKAEACYLQAIEIDSQAVGKDHPKYIADIMNLAALRTQQDRLQEAAALHSEARERLEKTGQTNGLAYINCLSDNAGNFIAMQQYPEAKAAYRELLAETERVFGKNDLKRATAFVGLAMANDFLEDFAEAETCYLEGLKIQAAISGKETVDYAHDLSVLGVFYKKHAAYEKAERCYLEARAIFEKTEGRDKPNYGITCSRLANVYFEIPDYARAEALQLEAKAIFEKVYGKEHGMYAAVLNNLGNIYSRTNRFVQAEAALLESAEIRAKAYSKSSARYAASLENLGNIYQESGQNEKALVFTTGAMGIYEKLYGRSNSNVVEQIQNLARTNWALHRYDAATAHFIEANRANNRSLQKAAAYLSEGEMLASSHKYDNALSEFQTFLMEYSTAELCCAAYDNALFHNGFLLENARMLARTTDGLEGVTLEAYKNWQALQREIAGELTKPLAKQSPELAALNEEAEQLEKMLTRNLAAFGAARHVPNWAEVRNKLRPGEAAIEFTRFPFSEPGISDSSFYAALVLKSGVDAPAFITLFEEKSLDSLLKTSGARKSDYVNGIYSFAERGAAAIGKPAKTLYEFLWQPLEKELAGVKTIYLSSSGLLHRVNLGAIPISEDETLADRFSFEELGSTRQLAVPSFVKNVNSNAILFGGIQYEMDTTAIAVANFGLKNLDIASRGESFDFSKTDSTARGGSWSFLKYTEKEVDALAPILTKSGLKPEIKKNFAATEEAFKNIGKSGPSPRVLHIATHGYFFPDPKTSSRFETSTTLAEPVFKSSDHPMIRSGLILAGANQAWKTGKPFQPGMEDGILTAYEISQMNLANTELVVLSACETGLGDIQGNEGVYGLQRAFKIAGAKNLIMSLWQVPDFQTQELMTVFYKKWLSEKMPLPEAFRAAQKEMREKYQHPYFWAGFVLVE